MPNTGRERRVRIFCVRRRAEVAQCKGYARYIGKAGGAEERYARKVQGIRGLCGIQVPRVRASGE